MGHAELSHRIGGSRVSLVGGRVLEDVGDVPVISSALNSLQTLIAGRDHGDYTLIEQAGARVATTLANTNVVIEARREQSSSPAATFASLDGTMRPNPPLGIGWATVGRLSLWRRGANGDGWSLGVEGGGASSSWGRATVGVQGTLPVGRDALVFRGDAGAGTTSLPGYRAFVLGGWGSLVGLPDRALGGRRAVRAELAWAMPVAIPMPSLTGDLHLRLPSTVSLVAAAAIAGGPMAGLPWQASGVIEPVAGIRLDLWGPVVRLESGVSLRTGRVGVTFDLHPDWWRFF